MTVRQLSTGAGEYDLRDDQLFAGYEQELFSHVVTIAEKEGKSVELLVVPAVDPFDAMVQTATSLRASKLVVGVSPRMASDELAHRIGLAWEHQPPPRHPFSLEITHTDRPSTYVNLGPHPPRLWPEDVDLLHNIWLRLCASRKASVPEAPSPRRGRRGPAALEKNCKGRTPTHPEAVKRCSRHEGEIEIA